jgi:pyroglutamyl-peptidase
MHTDQLKKLLITGFEPFSEFTDNPSEMIVDRLENEKFESMVLRTTILPVNTKTVWEKLEKMIMSFKPDVILNLGLSPKRSIISLEKVAINILDFDVADNDGKIIEDSRIVETSPDAYFSNLPLKNIKKKLDENDISTIISYSAGTYLCNQVFYLVMNYIHKADYKILGGFIHLPPVREMNLHEKYFPFCLSIEEEYKAIMLICNTILQI